MKKKGLFLPAMIAPSGYRFYRIEQYFEFELISLHKESGFSLNDIKRTTQHEKDLGYNLFLKQHIEKLEQERKRIELKINSLKSLDAITRSFSKVADDVLFIEAQPEMYISTYPIENPKCMDNFEDSVAFLSNSIKNALKHNLKPLIPLGEIIKREDALIGSSDLSYLFTQANPSDENVTLIPKGKYASFYHIGGIDSQSKAVTDFINTMKAKKLEPLSDIFVFDRFSFIIKDSNKFIAKYMALIEK